MQSYHNLQWYFNQNISASAMKKCTFIFAVIKWYRSSVLPVKRPKINLHLGYVESEAKLVVFTVFSLSLWTCWHRIQSQGRYIFKYDG